MDMTMLTLKQVMKQYGDKTVLTKVDAAVASKERIGLVGMNGAGKTTLAELIFGTEQPDGGKIVRHAATMRIGYLRQSTSYTMHMFNGMFVGADMNAIPEEDESAVASVDANLDSSAENERFFELSSHLGLQSLQAWDGGRLAGLSGGEKTKLAIARIWASKPDLLLLDEPTNHLDFQGVDWLIGELKRYEGAAIIISHDRYFLDATVGRIIELEDGVSVDYPGNYTFYREEKARRYDSQLHQYNEQRKYERKIEEEIAKLREWSDKAHRDSTKHEGPKMGAKEYYRMKAKKKDQQVKSRIHRLQKIEIEGVKKPKEEAQVTFGWDDPGKRGRRIVEASRIGKRFGERELFRESSFTIQRGERIGLIGPNGAGKTTFIAMMTGTSPVDEGELWLSPSARIAYLTQDVTDLNEDATVLRLMQESFAQRSDVGKARTLLANMGIDEDMLVKPIRQLSLGERTRVKLAQLILQEHDMLILDEPTNHLDLASREQLEAALGSYGGTLLVVSHDRYFVEKLCDKLLVIADGRIVRHEEGFAAYTNRVSEAAGSKELNRSAKAKGSERSSTIQKEEEHLSKQKREEERMLLANRISFLLGEISMLKPTDAQYAELDRELSESLARKKRLGS